MAEIYRDLGCQKRPVVDFNIKLALISSILAAVQPVATLISYADIDKITQGDPHVKKDLLTVFVKQNLENADKIQEYCSTKQWDNLRKAAHKLKSSLALVGLDNHRTMAEKLERSAGDNIEETTKMVNELASITLQIVAELSEKLKTL